MFIVSIGFFYLLLHEKDNLKVNLYASHGRLMGGSIGLLDGSSMVKIYIQALQSTVTESLQNRTILKWAQHFIFSLTFSHRGFKSIQKRVDLFTYCYRTKYFTLLQLKMVFYQVGKSFHLIFDRDASVLIQ